MSDLTRVVRLAKAARVSRGYSCKDISRRLNFYTSVIENIEDERVVYETLVRYIEELSGVLEIAPDWFWQGDLPVPLDPYEPFEKQHERPTEESLRKTDPVGKAARKPAAPGKAKANGVGTRSKA